MDGDSQTTIDTVEDPPRAELLHTLREFGRVRGVDVEIHAESWDGDPSVGIPYAPEEVYAVRADNGEPYELTENECNALAVQAIEIAWSDDHF